MVSLHTIDRVASASLLIVLTSPRRRPASSRANPKKPIDEGEEDVERPSRQDLRHALVHRSEASRLGITRRQADYLGRLYHEQGPRHPSPIFMGHDLRLRPEW